MGIELNKVIPLGRKMDEIVAQFGLSETDLNQKILDVGGGPCSFVIEMKQKGRQVVAIDPIYEVSGADLKQRIEETFPNIKAQVKANMHLYVWTKLGDPDKLSAERLEAMEWFLKDYEAGKKEGRYIVGGLPKLPFKNDEFDLALNSHFLFSYSHMLDLQFHIDSITEMLRVAKEIRIFPVVDLNANRSTHLDPVVKHFQEKKYTVQIIKVDYEFQKGGNEYLKIIR
jgi:ubiquinone/menaquinone biosynthesis C-methylase UbiE